MIAAFGLLLLALVGALLVATGLPAYAVLIFASIVGALAALATGDVDVMLLSSLGGRLINLLESDLLQAIPLFVLMGALLDRLGVVGALFRTVTAVLPRGMGGGMAASALIGALLGPMSGSVGASVLALSRSVDPRLADLGVPAAARQALVAVASTLGVVVPPSLVLILLGDALLSAHTLAVNATGRPDRIINTQDVMRAALLPAALVVIGTVIVAWLQGVRGKAVPEHGARGDQPLPTSDIVTAVVSVALLLLLLGGVATGRFYAVEAAAAGAMASLAFGLLYGRLGGGVLSRILADVMTTTGALFAPLLAATTFTLVLRTLGTDKLIGGWIAALPGGELSAVIVILAAMSVTALVLDAFEIIFVVVPLLVPPLLIRAPDAIWVAALVMLALQASFLIPPAGYALMLTRGRAREPVSSGALTRALLPYLGVQLAVLGTVIAFPALVHILAPTLTNQRAPAMDAPSAEEVEKRFREMTRPATMGAPSFDFGAPPAVAPKP